ncbi:branched-chain amino acid ABC transporter substrate-binding protein [Spongisporangium articulatum]|uniref:Branched-chain amino acid ABC transporter substrate-binding protein n=1 Tax=Spongisporangium articulatum TaxID=3362603 RepID=A0ABW8ARH4_9ACTN
MVKPVRALAVVVVATLAVAACGGGSSSEGGDGSKTLVISTDLPMQGSNKDASQSTVDAIKLYLEQQGNKAGDYTIQLKQYDDSTAATGAWDPATCSKNGTDHVANTNEVAVMGTLNSGCAKLIVPTLNQDPDGPMLMVSHANTNVGLTQKYDPGEPEKYFPSGERSFARVVTTDDTQGLADAQFAAETLKTKSVYVLNDNQTYGQGVAKTFATAAQAAGIKVIANEAIDPKAANYTALMQKIKSSGADLIFMGGVYDAGNGGQVIKDKVSVLGKNDGKVKFMAPDGWTGYTDFLKQPESEGVYLSFAGLASDVLLKTPGAGQKFLEAYKAKYGADPVGSYPLYGVAAVQVILAAIAKSDGTRKGVRDAVFEGDGITIPAAESVLGKDIKIDPATGDTNNKDISIELVKSGKETFLKAQAVS